MSEFELLQLEYMEYDRQQGLIGLIQSQAELISNDATMMSTLLFGYLVVAYFVGGTLPNLSRLYSALSMLRAFSRVRSQSPIPRS